MVIKCPKCGNSTRFDLFCSESWLVYFYQNKDDGELVVDETLTEASRNREYGDIFCAECDEIVVYSADHKTHHDLLAKLRLAAADRRKFV
ncbi:MAG: hypothetical protein ACE5E0_00890 [Terriglobia bacterium]